MSGFADDGFGEDVLALSAPQVEKKRVISKKSKEMNRQRKEEEEAGCGKKTIESANSEASKRLCVLFGTRGGGGEVKGRKDLEIP